MKKELGLGVGIFNLQIFGSKKFGKCKNLKLIFHGYDEFLLRKKKHFAGEIFGNARFSDKNAHLKFNLNNS